MRRTNTMAKYFISTLLLFLVCCGSDINEGIIVEKKHTNSFTVTTFMVIPSGKSMVLIPNTHFYPESFEITIRGFSDKKKEYCNRNVSVTEEEYDRLKIGMEYKIIDK